MGIIIFYNESRYTALTYHLLDIVTEGGRLRKITAFAPRFQNKSTKTKNDPRSHCSVCKHIIVKIQFPHYFLTHWVCNGALDKDPGKVTMIFTALDYGIKSCSFMGVIGNLSVQRALCLNIFATVHQRNKTKDIIAFI